MSKFGTERWSKSASGKAPLTLAAFTQVRTASEKDHVNFPARNRPIGQRAIEPLALMSSPGLRTL